MERAVAFVQIDKVVGEILAEAHATEAERARVALLVEVGKEVVGALFDIRDALRKIADKA